MKISAWWILVAVIVTVAALFIFHQFFYIPNQVVTRYKRKNYNILTFRLPNSLDMEISGPPIWEAKAALNQSVPCSICRNKAVPLGIFEHDIVNGMIDKPIFPFDRENWKTWVAKVNELDKKVS